MDTKTTTFWAVTIICVAKGHYTVNDINGTTISFNRLADVASFIMRNWSEELVEAQYAA